MLTPDEIAAIPLFRTLAPVELEMLSATSADIHLGKDEFAVHEGEEPALFIVVAGNLEGVKQVDGAPKVIGQRQPGKLFGEIPMIYGTPFQAGFRATEPSRVMRIEARTYQAIAKTSETVRSELERLARERIGGLQSIAAQAHRPHVIMIGHRWDSQCLDIRRFLSRNRVTFDWLKPESPELAGHWRGEVPEESGFPAVQFAEGETLTRPTMRQLADGLNLQTRPKHTEYDTVIIGAGPAGLAAAVYGASEGLRTVVVEREAPGGQAGTSSRIENYLGFPNGVSGDELASRALLQAQRLGAEILIARTILRFDAAARVVYLDDEEPLLARTVILASGVSWRRLDIEGFDRLIGKGVYYGAARSEASVTQGLDVHLVGAGNSAGQAALFFSNYARSVTLIVRSDSLDKGMSHYLIEQIRGKSNISVDLQSKVAAIHGSDHLTSIDISNAAGVVRRVETGGLFIFIGADAETGWLPPEIVRDARGYVLTGADLPRNGHEPGARDPYLLETSVPGVFACGDVRFSPVKRVASAVGEGSMAIAFVHQYLSRDAAARH